MLKFRTAALLACIFVVLGAVVSGQAGITTLQGLTSMQLKQAVVASVAAALTVTIMTFAGLPVSTSQAVVGAILGIGVINQSINVSGLGKVLACWVGTPVGAALAAVVLFYACGWLMNRLRLNLFESDAMLRILLMAAGSYGAYALGANNVANVSAVFVGAGAVDVFQATVIGGASIALGIVTFSRPVMETVGRKLVRLDPFSALIAVLALSVTMHFYTLVGVPVSSSQAIIGSVLGIGLVKGINTVNRKTMLHIFMGWFLTPAVSGALSVAIYVLIHLRYVPP
jgi:PiT family inorganic phosphate transporter